MNQNKIAYSEVYSFIDQLPPNEYYKIPKEVIDYINWHRDYNFDFKFDSSKSIDEQNISKEARALILKLYLDYFANDKEKQIVINTLNKNELKLQEELKKKYNPDNIF